jgi:hypothetical protein
MKCPLPPNTPGGHFWLNGTHRGSGKKKAPLGLKGHSKVRPVGANNKAGLSHVHCQSHAVCRVSDTSETNLLIPQRPKANHSPSSFVLFRVGPGSLGYWFCHLSKPRLLYPSTELVDEAGVPHDDLFPIELLRLAAQQSILAEFSGRRPSVSEVASLPDDHLMKLAGFGPSTIRKVRSITQSGINSSSAIAGLDDAELLSEYRSLRQELTKLREEFHRREREFQGRLRAIRLELRVRGLQP